ncbi:MAG: hypothetical protein HQL46_13590 [Gammaproteobacteria bacterium]|nr:hypothetical protein [Gammaproteobacteria bacterium]
MTHSKETQVRKVMYKIEHKIPDMNNKAISEITGEIYQADFELLAESIAIMRAQYLKKVVDIAREDQSKLSASSFNEARECKLAFQEAIESFNQLKRALHRGHFTLADANELSNELNNEEDDKNLWDDSEN